MKEKEEIQKKTDRIIAAVCILMVTVCLIFGVCFKYRFRLAEPVFVEQNTAVTAFYEEDEEAPGWYADITLCYITGRGDNRRLQSVEFPELGQQEVMREFSETPKVQNQYVVHTVSGRIPVSVQEDFDGYRVLTRGKVVYTDGSEAEIGLGNMVLAPGPMDTEMGEVVSSSSSSDGKDEMVVRMKGDATLNIKQVLSPDESFGTFSITVNGRKLAVEPDQEREGFIKLKEGDTLTLQSQWNGENAYNTPSGLLSSVVILELEGRVKQTLLYVHAVLQPAGGNFINIWKYLNQRGVF
ncbi:hypothetical protein [Clostridium transplantifaecale]|uniref:hypothetical protein n=1 Tax=Clostridium transplantifaecale TaxID=2479838 RepID=UPI001FAA72BB|nr:hypothetical protein [Clostridium transplantifaecale]